MPTELRLLGAAAVLHDGRELALATRKSLALLAYLALNGATARGKLADVLWSEVGEDAARSNLRKELFRLRETPLRDALNVTAARLELFRTIRVDALEFIAGCETGDEAALDLYAGPLLEGFEVAGAGAFEDWLEETRLQISSKRTALLLIRAARLERLGDWRGALAARLQLLSADALQESNHREVMRLHWQLGERAAALDAFDHLATTLQRELGLTPLPETLAMLSNIQYGAAPTPASSPSRSNAPDLLHPPLIGREAALEWLEARRTGMSLLVGELGVGKTRLAEDALSQPRLVLRGFESASATPLYALAEALRPHWQRLSELESIWRLEVARLLPELLLPDQRALEASPDGRSRFLEGLTRAVQLLTGDAGALLLDDLHWFDAPSLEFVAHLVRRRLPLRIVATARGLELSDHKTATALLASLEREGLVQRFKLEALSQAQTLSLLQALSGGAARLFAKRLQHTTGGNPLLTLETLRGLFTSQTLQVSADGAWITPFDDATADYTELPIPDGVMALALSRVAQLGGAVQRLLEVAALSTEPFSPEELQGTTALSEWEQLEALDRALSAAVVRLEGTGYRFTHDLLRRSLRDQLSPERGRLIHRRLAQTLIQTSRPAAARVAHHLELGGREADATPWHLKAGAMAQSVYAHDEARRHFERSLELATDQRVAFSAHAALAELELTLLNLDALETHVGAMLMLAAELRDPALEVTAQLSRTKALLYRGQYGLALKAAQDIVERATEEPLAEALTMLGTALIGSGRLNDAEPHLERVLQSALLSSPLRGESHALLKEVYRHRGDLPRALEQARSAQEVQRKAGRLEAELTMQAHAGQILGLLNRNQEAIKTLRECLEQARRFGFERVLSVSLGLIAGEYLRDEQWLEAETAVNEGLRLTAGKMLARECQFTGLLARVQQRTGQSLEALVTAEQALTLSQQLGHPLQRAQIRSLLAELHLELGHLEAAELQLRDLRDLTTQAGSSTYDAHFDLLSAKLHLERGQFTMAKDDLERARGATLLAQRPFQILFEQIEGTLLERSGN